MGTVSEALDVEHIPISPSSELVLKVEEIPPLDVFYSPQHKAVVRKQRKKRKLESTLSQNFFQTSISFAHLPAQPQNLA